MKNAVAELKGFFGRFRHNNNGGGVVIPKKEKVFNVWAGMCVHRDIKVKAVKARRLLEACPNPKITVQDIEGDALIARSRGRMATGFLKSDAEVLLFLDDDIVYEPQDIQKMLLCQKQYDLDIVGAAYAIKDEQNPNFAIRTLNDGEFVFGKKGSIIEVMYISAGCMAVKRRVFEKMIEAEMVHLCHPDSAKYYPFFIGQEKVLNGKWTDLSEDWSFCEKARQLGFRVWCDTTIKLHHIGLKTYDWDDFLMPKKIKTDEFIYKVQVTKE